jgi:hypothetical protein
MFNNFVPMTATWHDLFTYVVCTCTYVVVPWNGRSHFFAIYLSKKNIAIFT